jgi:hypothetical protein
MGLAACILWETPLMGNRQLILQAFLQLTVPNLCSDSTASSLEF